MGPMKSSMNDLTLSAVDFPILPATLAGLIKLVDEGKMNFSSASQYVFPELLRNPKKIAIEVAQQLNVIQESDEGAILSIVNNVIDEFPSKVDEYRKGKKGLMAMFMGEVMKRSGGKADPRVATKLLKMKLEEV
jgi:aspartyl-tRNA(Asn)/glutamyl-tRNA(Gln) amidotransferase subunit B